MRVLLADNNLSNRIVAKTILEREQHAVTVAENGADAIAKIQSAPHDVVLLDIAMPVMDGLRAVRYLNSSPSRPDFIFALSAYDTQEDFDLYRAAGFDGLIAKPLRRGDLRAAMRSQRNQPPLTSVGFAANVTEAAERPLLDPAILNDGPGQTDEFTRQRLLNSYRDGLSAALREISAALPGCTRLEGAALARFQDALHDLRSASLMVGLDRVPFQARQLRHAPPERIAVDVADLLRNLRNSLPLLEAALQQLPPPSVAARQGRPGMEVS